MATAGMTVEDETEMELAQKGHIKEEFTEFKTVKNLFRSLPNIYKDQISVELALEQFTGKFFQKENISLCQPTRNSVCGSVL